MNRPAAEFVQGPALKSEIPSLTVPQFVRDGPANGLDRIAFIDGLTGRTYSYGDLDRSIGRCAAGLAALGFKPGETLLMFAPNWPEWPIVALGALAAGGIVSGANPMCSAEDLRTNCATPVHASFSPRLPFSRRRARRRRWPVPISSMLSDESDGALNFSSLLACQDVSH